MKLIILAKDRVCVKRQLKKVFWKSLIVKSDHFQKTSASLLDSLNIQKYATKFLFWEG